MTNEEDFETESLLTQSLNFKTYKINITTIFTHLVLELCKNKNIRYWFKVGIPYFRDWKPGRFRTTSLIRQMWFVFYLEYVVVFAKCCNSFTWSDLILKLHFHTDIRYKVANHNENFHLLSRDDGSAVGQRGSESIEGNENLKKNEHACFSQNICCSNDAQL